MRIILSCISVMIIMLSALACSDPLSDDENIVRTLINEPLAAGEYSVFWDGTDDAQKWVEPGKYVAILYTRNFTYADTLTVLSGSTGKSHQNPYFRPDANVLIDELTGNTPDPFHLRDGTNIVFQLRLDIPVRLTIQTPDA